MFTSSSKVFKLLVWLFCVGAMVQFVCPFFLPLTRFCGVEDNVSNRRRRDAPVNRWPAGSNLTFRVSRGPSHGVLKHADIGVIVKVALREWAPHCGLYFTETHSGEANITVSFERNATWNILDGQGGVIAYTSNFLSKTRMRAQVYFDDDEEWSLFYAAGCQRLYKVLLHELGHTLGLAHSDHYGSIMYAFIHDPADALGDSYLEALTLQKEDISRMRKLYDIAGTYSGSIIDNAWYSNMLFSKFTADAQRKENDEDSRKLLDFDYVDKASTTESSEGFGKNTTDEAFVEASTTQPSDEFSKTTIDEAFVEASTTESSDGLSKTPQMSFLWKLARIFRWVK